MAAVLSAHWSRAAQQPALGNTRQPGPGVSLQHRALIGPARPRLCSDWSRVLARRPWWDSLIPHYTAPQLLYFSLTSSGCQNQPSPLVSPTQHSGSGLWAYIPPTLRLRGYHQPIRGQYPGHVITLSQSEASIQVTWSLSAQRRDLCIANGSDLHWNYAIKEVW